MYDRERVEITSQGEMRTITDPRTGQPIEVPTTIVTVFNGTAKVKIVDDTSLFNASSAFNRAITVDDVPIDSFIRGAEQTVANILAMKPNGGGRKLRDSSKKYFDRYYGEDADIKKVLKDFHINVSNQAGNLMTQYGIDRELALKLSATMKLQNIEYMEKNDDRTEDYKGANLASTTEVNGLRVFEALNYLNMTDDSLVFDSPAQLKELTANLLTPKNLTEFTGQGVNRKGMTFDSDSRTYYIKNMSKSDAVNNLYKTKVVGTGMTVEELILARRNTPQIFNVDGTLKEEKEINKILKTTTDNTKTTSSKATGFVEETNLALNALRGNIIGSVKEAVTAASKDQVDSATLNYKAKQSLSDEIGDLRALTQSGEGSRNLPDMRGMSQTIRKEDSLLANDAYGERRSRRDSEEVED
tara:strand:- start:65 stop:1306 length:1242 start_codon:yes stop_codon:yes gene_type:complete